MSWLTQKLIRTSEFPVKGYFQGHIQGRKVRPSQSLGNQFWSSGFLKVEDWIKILPLYICAKSLQSCPTLCNPINCSLPGSSVHGILQARILEWVAMTSSTGSSQPRNRTLISYVSCIDRWVLYLVHLRILPCVHEHLLAKVDSSRGLWVAWHHSLFDLQRAFLPMCSQKGLLDFRNVKLCGLISYPGRDQPLLLSSCYLRLGVHREWTPAAQPGAPLSSALKPPKIICLKNGHGFLSYKISLTDIEIWTRVIFTCHEVFFFSTPPLQKNKTIANYKLALTKSIANDWTIKAFAICLYGDWTPCRYSCWPWRTPEGVQSAVRHSVLQGIWWDRSLDSWMFLGTDFMISILASPHI